MHLHVRVHIRRLHHETSGPNNIHFVPSLPFDLKTHWRWKSIAYLPLAIRDTIAMATEQLATHRHATSAVTRNKLCLSLKMYHRKCKTGHSSCFSIRQLLTLCLFLSCPCAWLHYSQYPLRYEGGCESALQRCHINFMSISFYEDVHFQSYTCTMI